MGICTFSDSHLFVISGKLDLMRANWEGRIRSLHDDKRRLAEKNKHLEEKLKHLEEKVKKKGKEKILTEEEGMLAALPNVSGCQGEGIPL